MRAWSRGLQELGANSFSFQDHEYEVLREDNKYHSTNNEAAGHSYNRVRNRSRHFRDKLNGSIEVAVQHFQLDTDTITCKKTTNRKAVTKGTQVETTTMDHPNRISSTE
ncbi:hypothetical protein Bbelb_048530 [Branchiostoma belcheri]|nr:hypothetical protein Bbelb_048530 [Branchiostoma belcheri]